MSSISTLLDSKGVKLENQRFTWKEMVGKRSVNWMMMHLRVSVLF